MSEAFIRQVTATGAGTRRAVAKPLCAACLVAMPLSATLLVLVVGVVLPVATLGQGTPCIFEGPGKNAAINAISSKCHRCRSGSSDSGNHRRAQGCTTKCSVECARALVPGYSAACLQTTAGAQLRKMYPASFAAQCKKVHDSSRATKKWHRVYGEFLATDPGMKSRSLSTGTGAAAWGIWRDDPGPRGVTLNLRSIRALEQAGTAPSGWQFNKHEWWLEEHGLIMEIPAPLPHGKYKVRWLNWRPGAVDEVGLTVDVTGKWALDSGAKLHDVTHLPCRAAKYTPGPGHTSCVPEHAPRSQFPVTPGGPMPATPGCSKVDYAVLFLSAIWK